MTHRWGITLPIPGLTLLEHGELCRLLPQWGYTDAWSGEANEYDAFTPLVVAAMSAPELRIGTAVVPAFTRGPAVIAQSAAALAAIAPDRFILGIGSSSPVIVSDWNGCEYTRPLQRTRDVLAFLRRALNGERVSGQFDSFAVSGFRLDRPPTARVPVYLAALRPRMLRLAGQSADGVILNWLAASDVPACVGAIGNRDCPVVVRVMVMPTEDAELARAIGRRMIAAYLTVPAYADFHRWLGRQSALGDMWDAWGRGDRRAALAAIPDEVVDDLVLHGTPDVIREKVLAYVRAGAQTPVMAFLPGSGLAGPETLSGVLSSLGREATVRGLR